MKRLSFLILCLFIANLTIAGCGGDEDPTPTSVPATATAVPATSTSKPAVPTNTPELSTPVPAAEANANGNLASDAYPAPVVQSATALTGTTAAAVEAYPAPVRQSLVVTQTEESVYPAPCSSVPFSFVEPIRVDDKIVKGKGPAGVDVRLVNVTTLGDILGPDITIDNNNDFTIPLSDTLRANHSIGIQVLMPDGDDASKLAAELAPCANKTSQMMPSPDVGFMWAKAIVAP